MLRIYHNPRCSKSRQAMQILDAADADVQVYKYLDNGFTEAGLRALIGKFEDPVADLLRRNEDAFKALDLGNKELDTETVVAALLAHPRLLQRPVIETDDRAIIARPPERTTDLLG